MKILVTGSQGFIGPRAIEVFGKKHEVKGVDLLEGLDLADFKRTREVFDDFQPDYVIHCAASSSVKFCEENKEIANHNNIIATRNIATLCAKYDSTVIFCSTDHVYRYSELPLCLHEYNEIKGASHYGFTKAICEQEIRAVVKKHYITRLCWQYGIYEEGMPPCESRFGMVEIAAKALKNDKPITVVKGSRQHTSYVYDTIDVFSQMIEQKLPYGVYNVTSENELTVKGLYTHIFRVMGADEKKILELIIEKDGQPNILTAEPYYLKCLGYRMPSFEKGLERYMQELHETADY